jgi:hypothetical protein
MMEATAMKSHVTSPAALARLRVLCTVLLGALGIMLLQVLQDAGMLLLTARKGGPGALSLALVLSELAAILLSVIIAYRIARHSKLPGAPMLLGLVALMWTMILIGHFS